MNRDEWDAKAAEIREGIKAIHRHADAGLARLAAIRQEEQAERTTGEMQWDGDKGGEGL